MSEQRSKVYMTIQNDTWDLIAFKTLGDERYTSHLLKENPDLNKIVIFKSGVAIKIPDIKTENSGVEPPWIT